MTRLILSLYVVLNFTSSSKAAEISQPSGLSYADAATEMLKNNPDLLTNRAQEESLKFKSIQALSPNEPTLSLIKTDITSPSIFNEGGATIYAGAWTLGFPGKALASSRQFEHQAQAQRETSFQKEIELLTTLSNTYVELAVAGNTLKTLHEELIRAEQTIYLTQKRYSSAQAAQTDILNAKFYKTSVEHDILAQEAARDGFLIQFRSLLRRPEDATLFPEIASDWSNFGIDRNFTDLKNLMFDNRPALRAIVFQKNAASSALTAASLSAFPDLQFTATRNVYHIASAAPVTGLNLSYTVGLGIVIPIFYPFNELSGLKAARMDYLAAESAEDSARINLISELQNLYTKYQSESRLYKSTDELVIPAAKANYSLSLKTFEAGKLDYLKLLDARKNWIQAQRDLLEHKKNLAETVNQITLEVGCDWVRKGVPHACQ